MEALLQPQLKLLGQTAWISGAASGMGEAISRLFAREGAAVAMADVQREKGLAIAADIRNRRGKALFMDCDVGCEDAVRVSIERTVREFGGLQILVNCAGIVRVTPLHELKEADWD